MKKLSLLIMLLMWSAITLNTISYAADDDLSDLEWLLDGENTWSNTDENMDTNTDENMNENTDEQVWLELSWVTSNSINLTLKTIDGYTDYKVYYTKEWDDNVWEKEVTTNWESEVNVELTWLEPATSYSIVAKAFDEDGNPIESTASDALRVTTNEVEKKHEAPADNVIYNPTVKTYNDKIVITYKPGVDVKKIQISMSEDAKTWKPVAVVDNTTTEYTIKTEKPGTKYIKLVPVAEDGTLWVCKIGTTDVKFLTAKQPTKKEVVKKIGKPKTVQNYIS